MRRPFICAPRPFWCSARLCRPTAGAGAWCVSYSEALQNLLYQTRREITALVIYLSWYWEATEVVLCCKAYDTQFLFLSRRCYQNCCGANFHPPWVPPKSLFCPTRPPTCRVTQLRYPNSYYIPRSYHQFNIVNSSYSVQWHNYYRYPSKHSTCENKTNIMKSTIIYIQPL
jgi:hypothetical protein